jgi:hypothetical protein
MATQQIKNKQENPRPPPDQKEMIISFVFLLVLTGKGGEAIQFSATFLGKIPAISIF